MIFPEGAIRDRSIKDLQFGSDQRIVSSRASVGYAIAGEVDGVTGFVLVSGSDAVVQGLMARSRGPLRHVTQWALREKPR